MKCTGYVGNCAAAVVVVVAVGVECGGGGGDDHAVVDPRNWTLTLSLRLHLHLIHHVVEMALLKEVLVLLVSYLENVL